MSALIPIILSLLETILPSIGTSSVIAKVIETLIQIVPIIVQEVRDLLPMVKNIIAALKDNSAITADQMTQLETLDAQCDADFEAAATNAIADQTIDETHPNSYTDNNSIGMLPADHPNAA